MKSVRLALTLVAACAVPAAAQDAVQARMQAWSQALGVECAHCHVPGAWSDASKPAFDFAQRMTRMVSGVNAGALKGVGEIACWTCHRGQPVPARLPRESWEAIQARHAADFAGAANQSLGMSVYAASLGVECAHCHVAGAWTDLSKPSMSKVPTMLSIFEQIPTFFDASRRPRTQCFMCHQGKLKPELVPPAAR